MKKSKLIRLYETFDSQQLEWLRKWINSPVHNKHPDVTKLFEYLLSKNKLTPRVLDKEKVFAYIYPERSYNDLRLRHLMSLGVKNMEQFVSFSLQEKEETAHYIRLTTYCINNSLDKYARQYIKKAKKQLDKTKQQNAAHFYYQYQLEQAIFEQRGTKTRIRTTNLQAIFDQHATAFIIETLRYACKAASHQNIYKGHYDIPLLEHILEQVTSSDKYVENTAIQFYYYSYKALTEPEEEAHFATLQQLLFEHKDALPASELKDIYLVAINYCVKRLNTGHEEYVSAVFELFKYGLEYETLIEDGKLSRFTYHNIFSASLRLKEHKWTADFIEKYTSYLEDEYQNNYQLFAYSKLAFSKGNYAKTLDLLWQVEFDDLFLNLQAKTMLIKIYYENEDHDALESLLSSFYVFLQRKDIMSYHRSNYKNIIRFTQKIERIPSFDKKGIAKLRQQIEEANPLTERQWLLDQLDDLNKVE